MKRHFILFHFILSTGFGSWSAQAQGQSDHFVLPPGKAIYQPKEFAGQDWYSDTSRYSYRRMSCTDNLAIFWEKGFGNDLAAPPDLSGKSEISTGTFLPILPRLPEIRQTRIAK